MTVFPDETYPMRNFPLAALVFLFIAFVSSCTHCHGTVVGRYSGWLRVVQRPSFNAQVGLIQFWLYAHPHSVSFTHTMHNISDFMRTWWKKQSEGVHKAGNTLTDMHTKRGPLYCKPLMSLHFLGSVSTCKIIINHHTTQHTTGAPFPRLEPSKLPLRQVSKTHGNPTNQATFHGNY